MSLAQITPNFCRESYAKLSCPVTSFRSYMSSNELQKCNILSRKVAVIYNMQFLLGQDGTHKDIYLIPLI